MNSLFAAEPGSLAIVLVVLVGFVIFVSYPKTRKALLLVAACVLAPVIASILTYCISMAPHPVATATPLLAETSPTPLPQPSTDAPKDRPAWIDAPARAEGDIYRVSVMVGPFTTRAECEEALPASVQTALDHYADACLADRGGGSVQFPPDELRQLVKERWEEIREYTVGPMTQVYALLEFDGKVRNRILELRREVTVNHRLQAVAGGAALVLLSIAGVLAGLKIHQALAVRRAPGDTEVGARD